ncbi:unnamed protein product [Caenorhabditis sp. 36 PRJEB53466]|nr:unnamed protein product [Caenorhabditis sp. 36 PRJEB53466]
MLLLTTVAAVSFLFGSAEAVTGLDGVSVEHDGEMCSRMCVANYSDAVEECEFGCQHRTGIRERINPFNTCFNACEDRFKQNILERANETEWLNRAWDVCLHACQLPYKTKIRWNVYIDFRSGEPIWNFERMMSDGQNIHNIGMEYDDLINTVALQENIVFTDPNVKSYSNPFSFLRIHQADNRMLHNIMMTMLKNVRQEMSQLAPHRFDGFSSIDYIGPRIVEHGPNGPTVTDIAELQYRPKEVVIYNPHARRDERVIIVYFLLFAFLCTMVFALLHLRRYHDAVQRFHLHRAALARQRLTDDDLESGQWAKKIPPGTAPPSYSSPEK